MKIERPIYRWFIYGYANSSSDEGHLGWLFIFGLPGYKHGWFGQRTLGHIYLHREGITLNFLRFTIHLIHRFGLCARGHKLLLRFGSYGLYIHRNPMP
jgi:hypothetical protein